ncbi:flagellar hook-associated protein FlgK [Pacificimonas flava]|uniref:Flagellar hook-associated protein 1 n=2 Tax=Pacificimonas TaxID=1960290 RepID=A0A219B5B3_9SPHN|nr:MULTISPECIES: flagellar hook-associated protein FlgK [Pacificimonas]MBZ6379219.1 flagellar hook-associated protein FlgK [Pacificimonas aurantium]OWV33565.1 flagellar hook-associated protein FlgK [Pacificimonas flava]
MGLNDVLGSAVSGLSASQAGLKTVSNNIANVGTPGYARERVALSTSATGGRVTGVSVSEATRVADRFLETTVYTRSGDAGRADVTSAYLDRMQALLGAPGSPTALPARLDAVAASATVLTGAPASNEAASAYIADVSSALGSLQQLEGDIDTLRSDVEAEVSYTVDRVNTLLERIHELNSTVSRLDGLGRSSAGAGDQRMSAIEELSGLVAVTVRHQSDGRVTIDTASGAVLLDRRLRQLDYAQTSGAGAALPDYPAIEIRFAEARGQEAVATGERIESASVGGKLGGLIDLRDRALPRMSEELGVLFGGLAHTLNAASNAATTVPAPSSLQGRQTGLAGGDRLAFTGTAHFAVTDAGGKLVAKTTLDFDALGAGATVDDAVAQINAGLGGAATASFTNGVLSFSAAASGHGVVVAQDSAAPSDRAGSGFSQYFGLNDLVRSEGHSLVAPGFAGDEPHGFGAGETAELVLRDTSGKALTRYTLTMTAGQTFGDIVSDLNASDLGQYGNFSLDDGGRVQFDPNADLRGALIAIPTDSTNRLGTGRTFSELTGLSGLSSGLSEAQVQPSLASSGSRLPRAILSESAAVGDIAIGRGDNRGDAKLVELLSQEVDFGKNGRSTLTSFAAALLGGAGAEAATAADNLADANARRSDAVNRRDAFSGVNLDEELSQMVVLQNSYAASARIISTVGEMYDALLAMTS